MGSASRCAADLFVPSPRRVASEQGWCPHSGEGEIYLCDFNGSATQPLGESVSNVRSWARQNWPERPRWGRKAAIRVFEPEHPLPGRSPAFPYVRHAFPTGKFGRKRSSHSRADRNRRLPSSIPDSCRRQRRLCSLKQRGLVDFSRCRRTRHWTISICSTRVADRW